MSVENRMVLPHANNVDITLSTNQFFSIFAKEVYTQQDTFGSAGSGNGQLSSPIGCAVTDDGSEIWVVDNGNDRIARFDPSDGSFIGNFGSTGTGNLEFDDPRDVAIGGGFAYIADYGNDRIQKVNVSTQAYVDEVFATNPTGVDVDDDASELYVCRNYGGVGVVYQYATDLTGGSIIIALPSPALPLKAVKSPTGRFYVSRVFENKFASYLLDYNTGLSSTALVASAAPLLIGGVGLEFSYLAVDASGHVYATRPTRHVLDKRFSFGQQIDLVTRYGRQGTGDGQLNTPKGVAVHGDYVYIVDSGNSRVVKIQSNRNNRGTVFQIDDVGNVRFTGFLTQADTSSMVE